MDGPRYVILGACNPPLAHKALQADPLIGALLPCNVMVIEDNAGGCQVAAVDPEAMFKLVNKEGIGAIATEVKAKLERVLARIGCPAGLVVTFSEFRSNSVCALREQSHSYHRSVAQTRGLCRGLHNGTHARYTPGVFHHRAQ